MKRVDLRRMDELMEEIGKKLVEVGGSCGADGGRENGKESG